MKTHTIDTRSTPERQNMPWRCAVAGATAAAVLTATTVGVATHPYTGVTSKTLWVNCADGPYQAVANGLNSNKMQVLILEASGLTTTVTTALGGVALGQGDYEQRPPGDPIIDVGDATLTSGELSPTGSYRNATDYVSLVCPASSQQGSSNAIVPALETR